MARVLLVSLVAGCALLSGLATDAAAMQLVPGGYGSDVETYAPDAPLAMRQQDFASSAATAGMTLDFTPRASGSLFSSTTALDAEPSTLSLSLGVQDSASDRLRLNTIGLGGYSHDPSHGLMLGGAMSYNDWQVSGSFGRANLLGKDADVFSAGVGYGRVNARLTYGHMPRTTGGEAGDLLMLSTDLAAWSWLTLEGDVAVSDTPANEALTVGRIGLRLNF